MTLTDRELEHCQQNILYSGCNFRGLAANLAVGVRGWHLATFHPSGEKSSLYIIDLDIDADN